MSEPLLRLESIVRSIEDIEYILDEYSINTTEAIENKVVKPVIRIHLVRLADSLPDSKKRTLLKYWNTLAMKTLEVSAQ